MTLPHPIVDVFSFWGPSHPLKSGSAHHYLIAPEPGIVTQPPGVTELKAWIQALSQFPGAAGLLLPFQFAIACHPLALFQGVGADASGPLRTSALLLSPWYGQNSALMEADSQDVLRRSPTLPVVIECGIEGFSRPPHLEAFLAWFYTEFPARACVLTHGGQLNISGGHLSAAEALFERYPHTYFETSGIYRQDFIEDMLKLLGPERLLYGSGLPRMDERLELERVCILPVDDGSFRRITSENAIRLFGLRLTTEANS